MSDESSLDHQGSIRNGRVRSTIGSARTTLVVTVLVVVVLALVGSPATSPGVSPETTLPSPGAISGSSGAGAVGAIASTNAPTAASPAPSVAMSRQVMPRVLRIGSIEELEGVQAASFRGRVQLGSISPDGRFGVVKIFAAQPVNPEPVDLFAAPLSGGPALALGTATNEQHEPNTSQVRLVEPAWSSGGDRVAFAAGQTGTIVSVADGTRVTFAVRPDVAITPLSDGGFLTEGPGGPTLIKSTVRPLLPPSGLTPLAWLRDGQVLVGYTGTGELVWTDGTTSRTIASAEDPRTPIWNLVNQSAGGVIAIPELMKRGTAMVVDGSGASVNLGDDQDQCESPVLSDDAAYVAYTICNRSSWDVSSYGIRIVRLADGAAIDLYAGAVGPHFIPGTHRLAWLTLAGPVETRTFTVSAATKEVLP